MTQPENSPELSDISTPKTGAKISPWVEYGPIVIFFVAYQVLKRNNPDGAIYTAAILFLIAAIGAFIYSKIKHGKVSGILVFTTLVIVVSVGLAYFFKDPRFLYMKPTVINALFGFGLLGGLLAGKNFIKLMFGEAYTMPEDKWRVQGLRWALFFLAMAVLNELVWRTQTEDFWVKFKLFGLIPLTFVFALSQMPFILKHSDLKSRIEDHSAE